VIRRTSKPPHHPDTGEALSHKGFMDWNLLVLEMI
jgi:putative isomerase